MSSAAVLALSAYLYRHASGEPVWRLNMLTYSFWLLTVLGVVASTAVAIGYDVSEESLFGNAARRDAVWLLMMWTMLGIPLGAMFANAAAGGPGSAQLIARYRSLPFEPSLGFKEQPLFVVVWVAAALLLPVVILQLPNIGAFTAAVTTGDVVGSQVIRREAKATSGIPLVDTLFNYTTLQLLSYIAYAMASLTARLKWRLLFGVLFVLSIFLSVAGGVIGHLLYYFLGFAFVRSMVGKPVIKVAEVVILAALLVGVFVFLKGAEGGLLSVLIGPVASRIVFGQMVGMYLALEYFPAQHDFIGFASTGRQIHEMLGLPLLESYGLIMMKLYNPVGVEMGYAGHLTTLFMAEAWANFGLAGVIVAPIWVGALVQSVNRLFLRRRKSVLAIALYAYLSITFAYAADFISFYYPLGILVFLTGVFAIFWFGRVLLTAGRPRLVKSFE